MRKEKYWSSSSSSNSGGKSSSSSSKRREQQKKKTCSSSNGGGGGATTATTTTVGGCMSAVFQLFDFHLPSYHTHSSFRFSSSSAVVNEEQTKPTGTEAPRNSLEVDESPSSSSSNPKIEDSLSLKMGIQIKTKTDKRDSVCSEVSSSSPGLRTPTLVARLMGLDLLPDSASSSPRPSATNGSTPNSLPPRTHRSRHLLHGRKSCSDMDSGSRSVPDTPKLSLSRRSDVDHYHRPSINKENTADFDVSRFIRKQVKTGGGDEGLSLSPGQYARQIVKQVKETVSRRSAMSDITNGNILRRDQLVMKNKKVSRAAEVAADGGSRLRFLETKPAPAPEPQSLSKRGTEKKAAADVAMRSRLQEETYVRPSAAARGGNYGGGSDKRCKKTTALLSGMRSGCGGGGGGGVPTVLPIKKDPSPPATKIPVMKQQQPHDAPQSKHTSHLSPRHRHVIAVGTHDHRDRRLIPTTTTTTTTTAKLAELNYVSSIFKCIGLDLNRNVPLPLSFTTPFTSAPKTLNPKTLTETSVFDDLRNRISFLEASSDGLVGLKSNQKLLLDLVEELTFDFFKPFRNFDLSVSPVRKFRLYGHVTLGLELVNEVKAKVESFPRADCHVLEDIDAIIDVDLRSAAASAAEEEEGGAVAAEIEGCIWNGLMQELAAM